MTLGVLLVLIALVLSIVALFTRPHTAEILVGVVILLSVALLIGVQPVAL